MRVHTLSLGSMEANCHIIENCKSKEAIIVDPGDDAKKIMGFIKKNNWKVVTILLTHGHIDHINALDEVRQQTGAEVYIHEADANMLIEPMENLSVYIMGPRKFKPAEHMLYDRQKLDLAGLDILVIHTPGHTPGGCCFKLGDEVIVGDSIFRESIGRTDFPGGSHRQLIKSLWDRILSLPDKTKLYSGHGPDTTVEWEKSHNPFL